MKLVVTEIEGGVDGLEWFKVDVDLAFLAVFGNDSAAVNDESVLGTLVVQFEALLRRGDGAEDTAAIDATLDVGGRAVLVTEHLVDAGDLVSRWNNERNHARSIATSGL